MHRTSGRIFKITYGDVKPPTAIDLQAKASDELVPLLVNANDWYARQALRQLQERAANGQSDAKVLSQCRALFRNGKTSAERLKGLWALHAAGGTSAQWLDEQLKHPDEHVRVWAIRLLMDSNPVSDLNAALLRELAETEESGLVLVTLASALQKLPPDERFLLASFLAQHAEYSDDRVFPLMVWYGVEAAVPLEPRGAAFLVAKSKIPLVRQFVARRLTQELASKPQGFAALIDLLRNPDASRYERDVLTGINQGLQGWRKIDPPVGWDALQSRFESSQDEQVRQAAREIAVVFGDGRAMDQLRKIATSGDNDIGTRRAAIASLV
ncbi:MAG: hypothetical protein B7Z55_12380, partial [Planctomycetales bacterium 12-60-4]